MPRIQWPSSWEAEIKTHFLGFAASFIDERFRPRWEHILLSKPGKAKSELHRFEHHYREERCSHLDGSELMSTLIAQVGEKKGLYFDGRELPVFLSGDDLAARFSTFYEDAIFSVLPGRKVFVFSHDGYGWLCVRQH